MKINNPQGRCHRLAALVVVAALIGVSYAESTNTTQLSSSNVSVSDKVTVTVTPGISLNSMLIVANNATGTTSSNQATDLKTTGGPFLTESSTFTQSAHGATDPHSTLAPHATGNSTDHNAGTSGDHSDSGHGTSQGVVLIPIQYHHVEYPLVFTLLIIFAGISKLLFHQMHFLASKVPESCLLITYGIIIGAILHYTGVTKTLTLFKPHDFFLFLLPPIILESAFTLHDRTFADNIGGVLLFAVLGTVLNCFFIGLSMWGIYLVGAMENFDITFVQVLLFCALIVAVDPVAVLAVFQEVGVNNTLYFLVFGESLLNDGVTVVLYNVMQIFNTMPNITGVQIVLGVVKFFVVCIFATIIGTICGLVSSFVCKYTNKVKVVEPLMVFGFAYLSYVLSELFQFSGIVSIMVCGLVQAHYAFHNIHKKSKQTVKFCAKVMAVTTEILIFLFLGIVTMDQAHEWKTGFALWALLFCLIWRFIFTYGMSICMNQTGRVRRVRWDEIFMISYGGLRGAVCFSLVISINEEEVPMKRLFVTTTLFIIFFTVFVQGGTIKWLVNKLKISLADTNKLKKINEEMGNRVFDHITAGVEQIVGYKRGEQNLKMKLDHIDNTILRPRLLKSATKTDLTELALCYENLMMKEHYKNLQLSGAKLKRVKTEIRHLDSELALDKLANKYESETKSGKKSEGRRNTGMGDGLYLPEDDLHRWEDSDIDSVYNSYNDLSTTGRSDNYTTFDNKTADNGVYLPPDSTQMHKGGGNGLVSYLRNKHMKNKALLEMRRNSIQQGDMPPPFTLSFNLDGSHIANGEKPKVIREMSSDSFSQPPTPSPDVTSSRIPNGYVTDVSVDEEDNGRVKFSV